MLTEQTIRCECGEWDDQDACEWSGPVSETVVVEYMARWMRESHVAAGNRGTYPANGSSRVRVGRSCAVRMIKYDGEWCEIV